MPKKSAKRRIQEEYDRLIGIIGEDTAKTQVANSLVRNAAFQCILLEDLQEQILKDGSVSIDYQNGANQHGKKKSPAFDAYSTTYKQYLATIKQLCDIAPEGSDTDALTAFNA